MADALPVSVVMPVFNPGPYLHRAIESILRQTRPPAELILVDDGSTDGSRQAVAEWAAREPSIRVIYNEQNLGVAASLNRAARTAQGYWLARMDADDVSVPERLAAQEDAALSSSEHSAISCFIDVIDSEERVRPGPRGVGFDEPLLPWYSLFYNRVGGGGQLFCARDVFFRLGGFDESIRYGEDRDLWVRLMDMGPVHVVKKPLYQWRAGTPDSLTKRNAKRFRYSEESLASGIRATARWCGETITRDEAVLLRDFWMRFHASGQPWDEAQRRFLRLAARFQPPPGHAPVSKKRILETIGEGWIANALRALARRDSRAFRAHLRRAREATPGRFAVVASRYFGKLAQVGGRADRVTG